MADELKVFPTGRLALGNGDLQQVTNVKHEYNNNGKLIHTLRATPAGVFKGSIDSMLSFDAVVSEDGYERDYFKQILNGTISKFRLKVPGETITVNGMATKRSLETSTDDAIKYSIEIIGRTEQS